MHRLLAPLLVALATACAPVYIPSASHVAMLQEGGDASFSGSVGTEGSQLNAAYAVTDAIAVRATGQYSAVSNPEVSNAGSSFRSAGLGIGAYWTPGAKDPAESFPAGFRASLNLDGAAAQAVGQFTLDVGGSTSTLIYSGSLARASLQGDIAYESRYVALGLALRSSYVHFWHDAQSEHPGEVASALFVEPVAFLRVGMQPFMLQLQGGVPLPVVTEGAFGIPFPMSLSLGMVVDL